MKYIRLWIILGVAKKMNMIVLLCFDNYDQTSVQLCLLFHLMN